MTDLNKKAEAIAVDLATEKAKPLPPLNYTSTQPLRLAGTYLICERRAMTELDLSQLTEEEREAVQRLDEYCGEQADASLLVRALIAARAENERLREFAEKVARKPKPGEPTVIVFFPMSPVEVQRDDLLRYHQELMAEARALLQSEKGGE